MKGFKVNIESESLQNADFRKVLYTASHLQLVLMSLQPGEDIGSEVHPATDQFFRFEKGSGQCIIAGTVHEVAAGDIIVIPAGATHNIINTGLVPLKMYTIYAPPNHRDGIHRPTKQDAAMQPETFDGHTTEQPADGNRDRASILSENAGSIQSPLK